MAHSLKLLEENLLSFGGRGVKKDAGLLRRTVLYSWNADLDKAGVIQLQFSATKPHHAASLCLQLGSQAEPNRKREPRGKRGVSGLQRDPGQKERPEGARLGVCGPPRDPGHNPGSGSPARSVSPLHARSSGSRSPPPSASAWTPSSPSWRLSSPRRGPSSLSFPSCPSRRF